MLACACANTAEAYRGGRWPRAVRIKRSGAVLEPVSGSFDVTVAPGSNVQAAVDRCPRGGCVLLLPGTHAGPLVLRTNQEVHLFGRGQATLRTSMGSLLTSTAVRATVDGVSLKRFLVAGEGDHCVVLERGALRLQVWGVADREGGRGAHPPLVSTPAPSMSAASGHGASSASLVGIGYASPLLLPPLLLLPSSSAPRCRRQPP